jgi:hypothetical protein
MKKLLFVVLLLLCVTIAYSQGYQVVTGNANGFIELKYLLHTHTNQVVGTADTTGWYSSVDGIPIGAFKTASIIAVSTDSVSAVFYAIGGNSQIANVDQSLNAGILNTTVVDSISTSGLTNTTWSATLPYAKTFTLRGAGADGKMVDVLRGCDRLKLVIDGNATVLNGTTTGRTLKLYFSGVY